MIQRPWRPIATAVATSALVLTAGPALADQLRNDLAASGPTTITLSGGTASTTIKLFVHETGGGCDVSPTSPAVYQVDIAGPAGVTPSPSSITLTGCGSPSNNVNRVPIAFTATSPGARVVTFSHVSGADLNTDNADFTLTVNGTANTAPTVTVAGVDDGASYEEDAVPVATCQVTDAQDGASSFPATLSAITGVNAAHGLGDQTASCSYTDQGGLTATASATYAIVDTTAPVLNTPGDQTLEATSPAGAEASWLVGGSDDVHLADASCDVTSPHTFDLGTHTVSCTATDVAGNTTTGSFTLTVQDTHAPTLVVGSDVTVEATGPDGATAAYDAPTASDTYDTTLDPTCEPPSGSLFPLGANVVTCSVSDDSGNSSSGSLTVTVQDTTAPVLSLPADQTVEMTSPQGAAVTFAATASDVVSGSTGVTCTPASGATFGYGDTTVSCSSTDEAGNTAYGSFTVTVQDTTPPAIEDRADLTAEATGPSGASVSYTEPGATDVASETVTVDCIPESGSVFALGTTPVNCTATDAHGLTSSSSFEVTVVDTTAPTLSLPGDLTATATAADGAVVTYTASATDLVDPSVAVTCTPASGATFAPGATTVHCSATDDAGNTANGTFTVTVTFGFNGFFAPVDNDGVVNVIKGGQSVPLKWAIPNGSGGWISSLGVVASTRQATISCNPGAVTDEIEAPTSGQTSLRYDSVANQYIYNWQSPKGAGVCYRVTVNLTDGTSKSVLFRTK